MADPISAGLITRSLLLQSSECRMFFLWQVLVDGSFVPLVLAVQVCPHALMEHSNEGLNLWVHSAFYRLLQWFCRRSVSFNIDLSHLSSIGGKIFYFWPSWLMLSTKFTKTNGQRGWNNFIPIRFGALRLRPLEDWLSWMSRQSLPIEFFSKMAILEKQWRFRFWNFHAVMAT